VVDGDHRADDLPGTTCGASIQREPVRRPADRDRWAAGGPQPSSAASGAKMSRPWNVALGALIPMRVSNAADTRRIETLLRASLQQPASRCPAQETGVPRPRQRRSLVRCRHRGRRRPRALYRTEIAERTRQPEPASAGQCAGSRGEVDDAHRGELRDEPALHDADERILEAKSWSGDHARSGEGWRLFRHSAVSVALPAGARAATG